ncbi:MAG: ATP-binding protein, partial [Anaerolineae bacterium]|nr:ATP-binding protein [Anaerolineae bacterium]
LQRATEADAQGYLVMPFDETDLYVVIELAIQRHKVSRILRENERWQAEVLNGIGDAVIATDEDGRVTFLNSAAEELTGWCQDPALSQSVRTVFGDLWDQSGQSVENPIYLALEGRRVEATPARVLYLLRDSATVTIDHTVSLLRDYSGRIVGAVLVCRDVTDLIGVETCSGIAAEGSSTPGFDQPRRKVTAGAACRRGVAAGCVEETDSMADRLIDNVSHTLRAPLTMILGYAELLESNRFGELPQAISDPIRSIAGYARAMSTVVDEMTLSIETEAGQRVCTMVQVDDLVSSAIEALRPEAVDKGLELRSHIDDLVPAVSVDEHGLRWAIDHLLGNAIKHTPKDGQVIVSLKRETTYLHLVVRDTGVGIPEMQMKHVFDQFPIGDSPQRRSSGLSLGLALVRDVVCSSGGYVDFDSVVWEGSVFHVYLPINGLDT